MALAAAGAPGIALAGEPGDTSLPEVPRLELVPPPALLLAQVSPSAAASPGPPPAAPPAPPSVPSPPSAAPALNKPPESGAPAAGGPGAARPPYPYPYPPYPYAYPGIPLTPPTLPYHEDRPIPPNYRLDERSNKALIITGFSLFGLAYGISLGVATIVLSGNSNDGEQFAPLFIPVVGPFITMATFEDDASATLTLNGVTQSLGVISILIGIFATDKVLVRVDPFAASLTPEVQVGLGSGSLRWRF